MRGREIDSTFIGNTPLLPLNHFGGVDYQGVSPQNRLYF